MKVSPVLVLAVLMSGCEGPTGPAGPAGPVGPQGGPGVSARETVTAQFTIPNNGQVGTYDVNCPSGKVPLSGGFTFSPSSQQVSNMDLVANAPTTQGWRIVLVHQPDFPGVVTFTLTVHAICAVAA
jgi:hypothetical protein